MVGSGRGVRQGTHECCVGGRAEAGFEPPVEEVAEGLVHSEVVVLGLLDGHAEDARVEPEADRPRPDGQL